MAGVAGDPGSAVHRLDPRAKLIGLLAVTVAAVSTPLGQWPVHVACLGVLAAYAAVARVPAGVLWRRGRLVLVPVLLLAGVLALSGPEGSLAVAAGVAVGAALGTQSAVLLAATTSFSAVLQALEALRVPSLLVLIASVTYRYLFVIAEEVARMRAALAARGYRPRSALGAGATGRLAAALFLRAYGRGERVHLAMLARGYAGTLPRVAPGRLTRADVAFAGALAGGLLALRLVVAAGP
jgi:cobalt/nickel transport system permease protein